MTSLGRWSHCRSHACQHKQITTFLSITVASQSHVALTMHSLLAAQQQTSSASLCDGVLMTGLTSQRQLHVYPSQLRLQQMQELSTSVLFLCIPRQKEHLSVIPLLLKRAQIKATRTLWS